MKRMLVALAAIALLMTACSDDAGDAATASPTTASEATASASTTASTTEPAATVAASTPASTEAGGGGASFTDDRGTTFEVPEGVRVVAETSAAAALLANGVELAGVFGQLEDEQGNPYGSIDWTQYPSVGGAAYGEINLEALSELDPDVIVTISWGPESVWWVDPDLVDEVRAIAPLLLVAVSDGEAGIPAPRIIERFEELSIALGGNGSPAEARTRYEDAEAAVTAAVAAHPDITLMFASAGTDTFYVADPPAWPDLSYYAGLGIPIIRTETTEGGFWEYLSFESIDKYDADHILLDDRDPGQHARLDADVPLWPTLPAVQAGQVSLWPISGRVYTYEGFAEVLELLASAISSSNDVG